MTELLNENNIRIDGRKIDELRKVTIKAGVIPNANGSAYVEFGGNKVMAAVYGPREVQPKHLTDNSKAVLKCRYHMTPYSVDTRKNPSFSRRENEISKITKEALMPAIILEEYPRTEIDVWIEILQSDGGSRCTGINAASVALADAGIAMRDLVAACAAGKIESKIALDLNDQEDKEGTSDMPTALMPNFNEVTLFQFDGKLTHEEFLESFEISIKGCKDVYEIQKEALRKKYFDSEDEKKWK